MANIHRLGWVVALALSCVSFPSFAKVVWYWPGTNLYAATAQFSTVAAACSAIVPSVTATGRHATGNVVSVHDNYCDFTFDGGANGYSAASFGVSSVTLADDPPPPVTCVPPMQRNPITNTCELPTEDDNCNTISISDHTIAGGNMDKYGEISGSISSGTVCVATQLSDPGRGCKAAFQRDVTLGTGATARTLGTYSLDSYANRTSSGMLGCAVGPTSVKPADSKPAPPDLSHVNCKGSYGTINGVQTCIPARDTNLNTISTKITKSETNPGDGSDPKQIEKTETTDCSSGRCVTTTVSNTITKSTTNGTSTTVTGSSTVAQSKGDYCDKNKGSTECGGAGGDAPVSAFGGTCQAGFACEGDAIQCAIAEEIHKQNCKLNEPTSASALFGVESLKTGNLTNDLPGNSTVNLSAASFDTSNALGGGATCIGDVPITVMGRSLLLPFSTVCPALENLGAVLLAVSFLLAARIVIRG